MESRLKNSLRNIKYGIFNAVLISVFPFITRTIFISVLGKNYLGIDSVFMNIINLIGIMNIGIGSAITFSVYKPIADGDTTRCNALFRLYRICYYTMGIVIGAAGLGILPFLDTLLKNKPDIPENVYVIYLIILLGTVTGYFFADKQCIITAHQKSYIVSRIRAIVVFVINVIEIIMLFLTGQYLVYLSIQTCQNIVINILVAIQAKKIYPQYFGNKEGKLENDDKIVIVKNTVALMFNRAGSLIINCTDSLVISSFVSVISAGLYSNYYVIKNMVETFTNLFTQSLTASIGNLNAMDKQGNKKRLNEVFDQVFFINFIIHAFCCVCMFCLFEPFIQLWLGKDYQLGSTTAAVITAIFYLQGVEKAADQFKAACGLYWQDRFRVFIEAVLNLIVSIALAPQLGILGVVLGTLISNICVTFWVEALIVYKYGLKKSPVSYYVKSVFYSLAVFAITAMVWFINALLFVGKSGMIALLLRIFSTGFLGLIGVCLTFGWTKGFRDMLRIANKMLTPMLAKAIPKKNMTE